MSEVEAAPSTSRLSCSQLPRTKLPSLDVYSTKSESSEPRQRSSVDISARNAPEAIEKAFSRWLLQLCNTEEACFASSVESGGAFLETSIVLAESVERSDRLEGTEIKLSRQRLTCSSLLSSSDFLLVSRAIAADASLESPDTTDWHCRVQLTWTDDRNCNLELVTKSLHSSAQESLLYSLALAFGIAGDSEKMALSCLNFPLPASEQASAEPGVCSSMLLHELFEQQAATRPDHVALDFFVALQDTNSQSASDNVVLTYAELNARAETLASRLHHEAKSPKALEASRKGWQGSVPLLLGPSVELYVAILAILKAGLAFSPLPVDAPPERIKAIIADQRAPFGLYSAEQSSPLGEADDLTWLDASDLGEQVGKTAQTHSNETFEKPCLDSLAYILYTSGSTGVPKGVQITHASAVASITAHSARANFRSPHEMRWFQFAAPTFDPSVMEIFVTLSNGATLCSARRQLTLNDLNATVAASQANIMMATPSLASLLRKDQLPALKCLWTMGEALNKSVISTFSEGSSEDAQGQHGLYNAYGPTEASINCTLLQMQPNYRGTILGPPLHTCSLFVVDAATLAPVPMGLAGELVIGGPQVSQRGYLNRSVENERAFVTRQELGGRVYRTGDAARVVWSPQGKAWIEILGRIGSNDGQVKIHGQRLELSEVEQCLLSGRDTEAFAAARIKVIMTPASTLAAVVFRAHSSENGQMQSDDALERLLRSNAHQQLPSFAWPSAYVFTSEAFSSPNGKLDKRSLLAFVEETIAQQQQRGVTSVPIADWEPNELTQSAEALSTAIRSVTGSTSVTPYTRLEASGLDSLRSMKLLDMLREISQAEDSKTDLSHITLADLVAPCNSQTTLLELLQSHTSSCHEGSDPKVKKILRDFEQRHRPYCEAQLLRENTPGRIRNVQSVLPVSATQAGMLLSFARSRSYVHHFCYELEDAVDLDRFCACAEEVFSECQAMQSAFIAIDDETSPFAQCILEPQVRHTVHRRQNSGTSDTISQTLQAIEESFGLDGPVFHQALLRDHRRNVYTISVFHGVFDGGSLELLLNEVCSRYKNKAASSQFSGPELAVSAYLNSKDSLGVAASLDYWKAEVENYEHESFPCLNGLRRGTSRTLSVGVEEQAEGTITQENLLRAAERLSENSNALPISALSLVQFTWASLLSACSETEKTDVILGSVVANRIDSAARVCAAPTFSTIPMRVSLSDESTILACLASLSAKSAASLPFAHPPLGAIKTESGKLPYDTLVALQLFEPESGHDRTRFASLVKVSWSPAMSNDFSTMLELWPGETDDAPLRLRLTYQRQVLDETSSSTLLSQFASILDYLCSLDASQAADPSSLGRISVRVGQILTRGSSMCAPSLLAQEGSREINYKYPSTLLEHFEASARQFADRAALLFQATDGSMVELSYAELNAHANGIAQRILEVARMPTLADQIVPLYANKSIEMYIAVLGILKAGGAWCPIEPTMPQARKVGLIRRTGAEITVVASKFCYHDVSESEDLAESQRHLALVLEGAGLTADQIIDVSEFYERAPDTLAEVSVSIEPSHLAYAIWTSGSTGEPKGVLIEHDAASRAMAALQRCIPTNGNAPVTMCFSAFTFDVFVQDIFYTWGLGGTVVSARRSVLIDVDGFVQLASSARATHAHLTPAFGACLSRDQCPSLKVITMIGEKLSEEIAQAWEGQTSGGMSATGHALETCVSSAWNTYGPAENAVVSTFRSFQNTRTHHAANVGWPLPGVQCLVIRKHSDGRLVPTLRGAVGELALAGEQVARGYLGDSQRTAERYPTMPEFGRVYLTGDVVRMLADGSLDFVGRRDDLVKISGIRVELSEISFALARCHPAVRHVETLYLPASPSDTTSDVKVLVAFLLVEEKLATEEHEDSIETAAQSEATSALPLHMRPVHYVIVHSIPRSAAAKTDIRALAGRFYEKSRPSVGKGDRASLIKNILVEEISEIVGKLASIRPRKSETLALSPVQWCSLSRELRSRGLAQSLSASQMSSCSTTADLAEFLIRGQSLDKTAQLRQFSETWSRKVSEGKLACEAVYPVAAWQEMYLSAHEPQKWLQGAIPLSNVENLEAVQESLLDFMLQQELFRTVFLPVRDYWAQAVLSIGAAEQQVDFVELACRDEEEALSLIELRVSQIEQSPGLKNGTLPWAISLVTFAVPTRQQDRLVLHTHPAVAEQPSLVALLSEFSNCLTQGAALHMQRHLTVASILSVSDLQDLVWLPDASCKETDPAA